VAKDYIGGRGLGTYLLNQEGDPNGNALSAPLQDLQQKIPDAFKEAVRKAPLGLTVMGLVCHLDKMLEEYYQVRAGRKTAYRKKMC
jgi:hypothetical protein